MGVSIDRFPPASTSAVTSVTSSLTNVTLLAANANRLGFVIHNDSNSRVFIKLGATATTTSYTVRLEGQQSYEPKNGYTGIIDGLWSPVVSGSARVTEITP